MNEENSKTDAEKAFILRQSIQELIPLIQKKFDMYQDLITVKHEYNTENNLLQISATEIFSHKPSKLDFSELDKQISKLRPRLCQLSEERKQRHKANSLAVNNLVYEIESLKHEINKLSQHVKYPHVTPHKKKTEVLENHHQFNSLPL